MGTHDRSFSRGDACGADDGPDPDPWAPDPDLQSINQIAHQFGVTARALRFYEPRVFSGRCGTVPSGVMALPTGTG